MSVRILITIAIPVIRKIVMIITAVYILKLN